MALVCNGVCLVRASMSVSMHQFSPFFPWMIVFVYGVGLCSCIYSTCEYGYINASISTLFCLNNCVCLWRGVVLVYVVGGCECGCMETFNSSVFLLVRLLWVLCHLTGFARPVWDMGWLRLVGSLNLYVCFAEYGLFCRALLRKRPTILRSLLVRALKFRKARPASFFKTVCIMSIFGLNNCVCLWRWCVFVYVW